jgi:DNA-binding FadR family transcriptional regulator
VTSSRTSSAQNEPRCAPFAATEVSDEQARHLRQLYRDLERAICSGQPEAAELAHAEIDRIEQAQ